MTYEELKIQFDLNEPIDILNSIGGKTKDNDWFIVCDDGDCYLFDDNGNEIDIKKIKTLNEDLIPKDIKKIIVPDSVKKIESCAFYDCRSLTSIIISNSVKNIGDGAFYNCKNLKSMAFKGKTINQVKSMEDYPFGIKDESIIRCI